MCWGYGSALRRRLFLHRFLDAKRDGALAGAVISEFTWLRFLLDKEMIEKAYFGTYGTFYQHAFGILQT